MMLLDILLDKLLPRDDDIKLLEQVSCVVGLVAVVDDMIHGHEHR